MSRSSTEQNDELGLLTSKFLELLAVLVLVISAYFLISLAGWRLSDPAPYNLHSGEILNEGGIVGAWLSGAMMFAIGWCSWLVPAMMMFFSYQVIRNKKSSPSSLMFLLKMIGMLTVISGTSGLLSAHLHLDEVTLPASSGGVLGIGISASILGAFGKEGGTVLLVGTVLLGLTVLTDRSLLKAPATLIAAGLQVKARLAVYISALRDWLVKSISNLREQRQQALVARQEKRKANNLVKKPKLARKPAVATPQKAEGKQQADDPLFAAPVLKRKAMAQPSGSMPALDLLDQPAETSGKGYSDEDLRTLADQLEGHLADFGVAAKVLEVMPGPVITRFEVEPAPGTKGSRVSGLSRDLARALAVKSVRVVDVIPGKSCIGIEIPSPTRATIRLKELLNSSAYSDSASSLTMALGHDIAGQPVMADLAKMPHLLVAGTTGAGKSVGINAMILSLLYKAKPEDVRLIMIDPKMLELSIYEGIPHLLAPVVTDMKEAANALRWCVAEMERRYKLLAAIGVRSIDSFNEKIRAAKEAGESIPDPLYDVTQGLEAQPMLEVMPKIVVIVDELADMMMIVGKKVEELIARLAQKARAAGIHLILATQRPSVDVITGLIKANIPVRIGFLVTSRIDSRTILDQSGAEQLLGNGDMLYLPKGSTHPVRVHGAFVDDGEVHRVVESLKSQGEPEYQNVLEIGSESQSELNFHAEGLSGDSEQDELYDHAVRFVLENRRASTSAVQRKFKIGYNRAARLIDAMEAAGLVSELGTNGSREILVPDSRSET